MAALPGYPPPSDGAAAAAAAAAAATAAAAAAAATGAPPSPAHLQQQEPPAAGVHASVGGPPVSGAQLRYAAAAPAAAAAAMQGGPSVRGAPQLPAQQQRQGPPMQGNPQFFVDQKRGELHELRLLLRQLPMERDVSRQRETLKKVIAYMTVGMDVSRLFSEIVMLSSTTDILLKKMVYFYLTNYAETNPSLSILAVNAFQKDCSDRDPRLRGLAIRSLCSLRVPEMAEYIEPALRMGLQDPHPYVRRVCIMGLLKLWLLLSQRAAHEQQPAAAAAAAPAAAAAAAEAADPQDTSLYSHSGIVAALKKALYDSDPQVTINAIQALNEVDAAAGGVLVTQELMTSLLNRIRQFTECGQCVVLNLLMNYQPQTDQERFDILNILDDRLKSSSAAVVLGCARCFLSLTSHNEALLQQALARLAPPLLTLVATSCSELAYTVLQHILLILETPGNEAFGRALEAEYQQFFCRYSDPSYIKSAKLEILTAIATEANAPQILQELKDCVSDADVSVGRQIIRSMGKIALRVPSSVGEVIEQVLSLLEHEVDFVLCASFCVFRDILRKHREVIDRVADAVQAFGLKVSGSDLSSVLWILGEFGAVIPGAPYLLETVADRFNEEEPLVQLELLTACTKLFFATPGEMQPILGSVLKQAMGEHVDFDVRDRALFIYRLMKADITQANAVFTTPLPPIDAVRTAASLEVSAALFQEFDTLSVVYRQPSSSFLCVEPLPFCGRPVHKQQQQQQQQQQAAAVAAAAGGLAAAQQQQTEPLLLPVASKSDLPLAFGGQQQNKSNNECADLLDFPSAGTQAPLNLRPREALSPGEFQEMWAGALATTKTVNLRGAPPDESFAEEVEAAAAGIHISTMVSCPYTVDAGEEDSLGELKGNLVYLCELLLSPNPPVSLSLQVKTAPRDDSQKAAAFADLLLQLLKSRQLVSIV
ncbi:hypothetical protein Efla_005959 [Eimeria flavescens]